MPFLKKIVELLNEELQKKLFCDSRFGEVKLFGMAEQMVRNEDSIELLPCVVDHYGEGKYVGPDDDYDVMAYHRNLDNVPGVSSNKSAYGDNKAVNTYTSLNQMVVFGKRNRIQMAGDELAFYIQNYFLDSIANTALGNIKLRGCNVKVSRINLNNLQVFQEEFIGIEYFLKPEQFLFKLYYSVESSYDKGCFTKC